MSYRASNLGSALGWKHNHVSGIGTVDGELTEWPLSLGTWPTEAQQAQWVGEYEAYQASTQYQDDELMKWLGSNSGKKVKAIALLGVDKGLWTLAELKAKYRSL